MMNQEDRLNIVKTSWQLHDKVEAAYLSHPAKRDDDQWLEKQRILLADMALHLLQTSVKPGEIELTRLRDNLHAILTISNQFLPGADLIKATEKLYVNNIV